MTLVRPLARPIAVVLLCAAYSGLFAQEEELDEIVVSADYRGRPVAEIPASITILDAETISGTAIQHFEELIGSGPILGMFDEMTYEPPVELTLGEGDVLLLTSDGLFEAESSDRTLFGLERAVDIIRSHQDQSATELVKTMQNAALDFVGCANVEQLEMIRITQHALEVGNTDFLDLGH